MRLLEKNDGFYIVKIVLQKHYFSVQFFRLAEVYGAYSTERRRLSESLIRFGNGVSAAVFSVGALKQDAIVHDKT